MDNVYVTIIGFILIISVIETFRIHLYVTYQLLLNTDKFRLGVCIVWGFIRVFPLFISTWVYVEQYSFIYMIILRIVLMLIYNWFIFLIVEFEPLVFQILISIIIYLYVRIKLVFNILYVVYN
jgi:hypothetical protein